MPFLPSPAILSPVEVGREAARCAERLVLETVRVMVERFKLELFDVFRWRLALHH